MNYQSDTEKDLLKNMEENYRMIENLEEKIKILEEKNKDCLINFKNIFEKNYKIVKNYTGGCNLCDEENVVVYSYIYNLESNDFGGQFCKGCFKNNLNKIINNFIYNLFYVSIIHIEHKASF